jgi:hypothetical protein
LNFVATTLARCCIPLIKHASEDVISARSSQVERRDRDHVPMHDVRCSFKSVVFVGYQKIYAKGIHLKILPGFTLFFFSFLFFFFFQTKRTHTHTQQLTSDTGL